MIISMVFFFVFSRRICVFTQRLNFVVQTHKHILDNNFHAEIIGNFFIVVVYNWSRIIRGLESFNA